jgi:hypothetical protein
MTRDGFLLFMEHVMKHIMVVEGAYETPFLAKENRVVLITFTTHITQKLNP